MTDSGTSMMKGVRILCALALILVGFAHKTPVLDGASIRSAELSQYVFPDGTPHVLCLPGEAGDAEHDHPDFGSSCEACRLSASVLLPTPENTTGWLIRLPADRLVPIRVETFSRLLLLPNAGPRGPPSELIAIVTAATGSDHLDLRRLTSA
jgi:hypothetical protein